MMISKLLYSCSQKGNDEHVFWGEDRDEWIVEVLFLRDGLTWNIISKTYFFKDIQSQEVNFSTSNDCDK